MKWKQRTLAYRWPDFNWSGMLRWLLPTPGNVIFTLLVVGSLFWAQTVGAFQADVTAASIASTGGIAYQGRLANTGGTPLTGTYTMIFRIYAAASGGAPLWNEQWTGASSVQVSDGLFNVMLGSLTPIPQAVFTGNSNLFLGITVGTDSEMSPRVQLGSVPFATQALTVPDGSVTTGKIQDGAITVAKLAPGVSMGARYQSIPPGWALLPNAWTDMPGAAITKNFGAGQWKVSFAGNLVTAGNNGTINLRLQIRPTGGQSFEIAPTTVYRSGWNLQNGASDTQMVVLQGLVTLPTGEVTIVPQVISNFTSSSLTDSVLIVEQ